MQTYDLGLKSKNLLQRRGVAIAVDLEHIYCKLLISNSIRLSFERQAVGADHIRTARLRRIDSDKASAVAVMTKPNTA